MKNRYLNIYIKAEYWEKLLRMAREEGKSPTTLVREWTEEKIKEASE